MVSAVEVFCSYSHKDEVLRQELVTHLALLQRRKVINVWHDRALIPGEGWRTTIAAQLRRADIILLLVSSDFIASDFAYEVELGEALRRHRAQEASVLPIIVRPTDWTEAAFADLQALPTAARAVTTWPNRDEAWVDVVVGIRKAASTIQDNPRASAKAPPEPEDEADRRASEVAMGNLHVDFASSLGRVMANRSLAMPDDAHIATTLKGLVEVTEHRRVLWVDDHPENNEAEISCLRRLQVEVTTVKSTEEALEALKNPYHLVLSDWERTPTSVPGVSEGLRLLLSMRERGLTTPVVFYYGAPGHEAKKSVLMAAGAQGATYRPDELFDLAGSILRPTT